MEERIEDNWGHWYYCCLFFRGIDRQRREGERSTGVTGIIAAFSLERLTDRGEKERGQLGSLDLLLLIL